ncbi:zyxin-like [Piliocolobus tephrosceles]|uniref:zyxin-like n=1 Tax=Piliocolobus tephrosceles TaxID=591936 RepID=UPI000E6AE6FD|nr:zyxin-like [Piliocolobus tephrosceles]
MDHISAVKSCTGSCGGTFSSQLPLPTASPTLHPLASPLHLPAYSRSSVFRRSLFSPPLHRLLPAYYRNRFLPHPAPFSSRLPTSSQQRLSAAVSSHHLLLSPSSSFPASYSPLFSSPPHHFLPVSISPPSRSSDFLPRFSLPASSPHRLLPGSSSRPLPSPRSPTAFHLEALHACARLCPCARRVSAPRQPLSWAPERRPSSQLETPQSRCLCDRGCPRPRRYLRTEQCWLRAEDCGAQKTAGRGGGGDGEGGKDLGKWDRGEGGGEEDCGVRRKCW